MSTERRNTRAALTGTLLALLAACGASAPPPRHALPPPPPAKPIEDDADKPKVPPSIYVYSPIGKRDPFQNVFANVGVTHVGPDRGHKQGPLEKWTLDQLQLRLTMTGTATPMAMVEDPDRRGWNVHLGDFIGMDGGKVTAIHRDEVVVTETITDHSTGRVYPRDIKLQVPTSKNETDDLTRLKDGELLGPSAQKGQ